MYLSKPAEGFCIPVLYIRKEHLDISELKDIASKEVEKTKDSLFLQPVWS